MSGSPARFKCQDCAILLTPKVAVSDKNGNKGRFFISCSGTLEIPHTHFFRFVEDPQPSPPLQAQPSYDTPWPALTNRTGFQPPVEPGRCAVSQCTKRRVNIKCARGACATHCRAMGGCSVNLHQSEGTASTPSNSQSFETPYMLSWSQPPLPTFPMATPTFAPLQLSPPSPPASLSPVQTASPSVIEAQQPPAPPAASPSAVHSSQARPLPVVSSRVPSRIVAEPPLSMNPLPDPRFASQMRPIFTTQASREQEMREGVRATDEQRLNGTKKVKHTVTVCAWLSDNDGPEESVHQGGFVWPNFCLSSAVLTDAGFQNTDENTWYHMYNHSRRSWQRVRANHFLSVDATTEILIKGVGVKNCARLDEYLTNGIKAADPPHFRTNLRGERASIKAKLDREFLELNLSTHHHSSASKHKSKRGRKVVPTSKQPSSSRAPMNIQTSSIRHSALSSKAISVSSSSPSPVPAVPHPQGDIINITDSDSSDMYWKPPKRRKAEPSIDNYSRMTVRTVVKQERHTSALTSTAIPQGEKQWPSDYPVLDVMRVLHSCRPAPPQTTVARHFYSLTGIPFKSSTYYDAWSKWDAATQEQRDDAEGCGDDDLWKDFAVQVPLKKTKLKVARQRLRRRQHTAEAEESDGSTNSDISSDSFNTASSN